MSVGVQREACRKMPQHARYGFDVHTVLQSQRCEGVPLRYPNPCNDHAEMLQHTPPTVIRFSPVSHCCPCYTRCYFRTVSERNS